MNLQYSRGAEVKAYYFLECELGRIFALNQPVPRQSEEMIQLSLMNRSKTKDNSFSHYSINMSFFLILQNPMEKRR